MNKAIDLSKLFKLVVLAAVAIVIIGTAILLIFGGGTLPAYCDGNLDFVFYIKCIITTVLACGLITLYFGIRFRGKNGFKAGLVTSLSACVSALASFFICVIFRAPLCSYVFSVILLAVCISLICAVVHFDFLGNTAKKSKSDGTSPSAKAFIRLLLFLFIILVVLFVAFLAALILDATLLTFYAFPACVTIVFSSVFTLSACGKLFDR